MNFNEVEYTVLSNALRVAADNFDKHANDHRLVYPGLAFTFEEQAKQARTLYDRIAEETGTAT